MNFFGSNNLGALEDELETSLGQFDQKLDSMQAGAVGGPKPQMGPQPPGQGQMGPPAPTAQMPEAYSQNRMAEYGMPSIFQAGEAMVDDWRANKWTAGQEELAGAMGADDPNAKPGHPVKQGVPIVVDEVEMLNSGGDPQEAYARRQAQGSTGSGGAMVGEGVGKVGRAVFDAYTGGMGSFFS